MRDRFDFLGTCALLALVPLLCLGCPATSHDDEHGDGEPSGDDDMFGDDDDATAGDDDDATPGDDDDDDATPAYQGEIDLAHALLYAECTPTVELDPQHPENTPEGWFEFEVELEGWAMDCFVNFWDDVSDYCEAYDPVTGEPCYPYGYTRPGWPMSNDAYGWDPASGFWDLWTAHIEYIMDLGQADAGGMSVFICENAGNNFTVEMCCQDDYTEQVYCAEYLW